MIKDSAKTILCYGDSNTWGNIPRSNNRYPRSVRWPSVLQNLLGDDFEVLSEGLPGRAFVATEEGKLHRTGITHLQALIESADPVDLLIIMLGTNDVKTTFGLSAEEIAQHLEETIIFIQSGKSDLEKIPKILIICPPPVIQPAVPAKSEMGQSLDSLMARGPELSKELPALYEKVAQKYECEFMNAGDYISSSKIDGYHLDAQGHVRLAEEISKIILKFAL